MEEVEKTESSSTANPETPQEPQVVPIAIPDVTAQPLPTEGASTQEVSPEAKQLEQVQETVQDKVQVEEKPSSKEYRELSDPEQELLLLLYDKHNGVVTELSFDEECLFHSQAQLYYYVHKYGFREKLVEIRSQRAKEVIEGLQDSKILAIRQAQKLLSPRHKVLMTKTGIEIFDEEGNPVIIELYPHYKEIVAAWEIIKVELGEPTTISKGDITTNGDKINTDAKEVATALQEILKNARSTPSSQDNS